VVLTGASKVVSGVETLAGGDTAEAIADNDPATTPTTSSAPSSLMQETVTAEISGGGNSIEVEAATGGGAAPCTTPRINNIVGVETGANSPVGTGTHEFVSYTGTTKSPVADAAVKRTGAYSLQATGGEWNQAHIGSLSIPGPPVSVLHFAIRLASLPTADVAEFTEINSTSGPNLQFGYESTGSKFRLTWKSIAGQVESTTAVVAGTWYVIDILYDARANPHVASWQVNGAAQPSTSTPSTSVNMSGWSLGTTTPSDAFTVNFDDMVISDSPEAYPLPDIRVAPLLPNEMGPGNGSPGTALTNNGGSAIDANTWTRLDDVPMTSTTDYVQQVNNGTSNYVEVAFANTTETCVLGVKAIAHIGKAGSSAAHLRFDVLEGTQVNTLLNGNPNDLFAHYGRSVPNTPTSWMVATQGGAAWTTTMVNGVKARFGYSSDANPDPWFHSMQLQYAYVTIGSGAEGEAGTETGSTASTTAASAGTPCGTPTQLDGRACTYAQEDYSTAGPPHLSLKAGVTGSDSLMARLYRFTPSTASGSTSYVWGRRAAGGGGVGTVKETVVRYPGTHTFAPIMPFVGSAPAGWLGYWLKYDAGTTSSSVFAEAGIGSAPPSLTSAGTISYWNGTGYSSTAPPAAGGAIPLTAVDFTAGGYRTEISGSLASSPSFTSQVPAGASGTADRNEARATLGSPVSGTFTYRVTYIATSEVVADLTISVDLGSLTATARYAP
jgi:hypothetical protein